MNEWRPLAAGLLLGILITVNIAAAPDPTALKVQGADTIGNAMLNGTNGATGPEALGATQDNTELTSAARTTAYTGPDHINIGNYRGIAFVLNVTVASGTGGLKVGYDHKDPVSGQYGTIMTAGSFVTTTGQFVYACYPGVTGTGNNLTLATSVYLPRVFRIRVNVGDATSYTYSLGYTLLP